MQTSISPQTLYLKPSATLRHPDLPVLIYKSVLTDQEAEQDKVFQKAFIQSGWGGVWKDGIFDYHHFHSNAHEALGIAAGHVTIRLGGEFGVDVDLKCGDAVVLPAGTGHKRIIGTENLVIIGAYPPGQAHYDICRTMDETAIENIRNVSLPETDPIYGAEGPLMDLWNRE